MSAEPRPVAPSREDAPEPTRSWRRDLPLLVGLILALVTVRLLVASSGAEIAGRGEEFVRSAVAAALTGGLDLPLPRLFYHPYEGGGFVHALLLVVVESVLGPTILAHKVVAIAWEVLVLLAGMLLVREVFGRRAALVFGPLWVLAPLAFQQVALLNLGIHYQALLFQFLLAWAGVRMLSGDASKALPAGLIGGFGLFYNYQMALLIGWIGLGLLVTRALPLSGWVRLVGGFLLGGLPLWSMALSLGGEVLDIHGHGLVGNEGKPGMAEVLRALGQHIGLRGWLHMLLLAGLPWLTWSAMAPGRRLIHRGLVLYPLLFLATATVSGFLNVSFVDYFPAMRYAPLYGFGVIVTAGTIGLWLDAGRRVRGYGALLALVALGGWAGLGQATGGREPDLARGLRNLATTRGRDMEAYLLKVAPRLELSDRDRVALLSRVDGVPRDELLPAVASGVYRMSERPLTEILVELQELDPEGWEDYLPGFGWWAHRGSNGSLMVSSRRIRRNVAEAAEAGVVDDELLVRRRMLEGLGRVGLGGQPWDEVLLEELRQIRADKLSSSLYVGFGYRAMRAYHTAPHAFVELLGGLPEAQSRRVREAFASARADLRP